MLNDKYNLRRTPEYLAEYKQLNAERRQQILQVLTPQEFDEYEMRSSSLTPRLRTELIEFKPSAEEFKAIYQIQSEIKEPYGGTVRIDMTEEFNPRVQTEKQREADNQIKELLGEQRFAEYQQAQDPQYLMWRLLNKLAHCARFNRIWRSEEANWTLPQLTMNILISLLRSATVFVWLASPFFTGVLFAAPADSLKIKQAPQQPKSGESVRITARGDVLTKKKGVVLQYQRVDPGNYVALKDAAFTTSWVSVPMNDSGLNGDAAKGDGEFTAELPAHLQEHRRLVRYRIAEAESQKVLAPAADDPQPNFAYFVYDGVPPWRGAINPRSDNPELRGAVTFDSNVMRRVQVYHLISKKPSVENATWFEQTRWGENPARRNDYHYTGTLVADGKVYDHIRFRVRGGEWRHAMGKNMWKIDFNRHHHLRARDDFGQTYAKKWEELDLGACIQQGDTHYRGEQGMFESVGFRLFNLAGVAAAHTHWVHLRIIDQPEESPANQYEGDFWGLYLAIENVDGNFLEEHHLPDSNLYKIEFGNPKPSHHGAGAVTNRSDVLRFLQASQSRQQPDAWWQENLELSHYYSYRSIIECMHHYDVSMGKNYFYYLHPVTKRWSMIPWDLDLSWADTMFGGGYEPFFRAGILSRPAFRVEYQNRLREIRDLLYNDEQTGALIDECAAIISDPVGGPSLAEADRRKWDHHPIMFSPHVIPKKARPGTFYQLSPTKDFRGMTQLMKDYVAQRSRWIDENLLADSAIPPTPSVSANGVLNFSDSMLKFRAALPNQANDLSKIHWRLAEVTSTNSPSLNPRTPRKYEIEAVWENEGNPDLNGEIPAKLLAFGHTYRVRARVKDATGRWSHYSMPVEFTVTR